MQALVLAGGEGTRLRPLTSTVPKPVLPLAGRPFLSFLLDWLIRHGVDDVVLSCGFLADAVREVLGERHRDVPLRYVNEEEPLGTAGPVRLAAERGVLAERFVVMNGDILTDADLAALVARPRANRRGGHDRAGGGGGHHQLRRRADHREAARWRRSSRSPMPPRRRTG